MRRERNAAAEAEAHRHKTAPHRHTAPAGVGEQRAQGPGVRAEKGVSREKMASAASSPLLLPALSLAVLALLAPRGGVEARPPPPLHGVRPLAFDEGYAQIFGSGNLALLRDGRRVRLALDESTGEHPPAVPAVSVRRLTPSSLLLLPRFRGETGGRIALLSF